MISRDRCKEAQERARAKAKNDTAPPSTNSPDSSPMLSQNLPLVCLPSDLSDEAAAQLLEFLYELARTLENHYYAQLHRHYNASDEREAKRSDPSAPESDPPF